MSRINYRNLIFYFLAYIVLQLPLLFKFVIGNYAFAFFYIGFLLFVPLGLNPFVRLLVGFGSGLLVDIFSNTPGLHAGASTLIMYIRDYWLVVVTGDREEEVNVNVFLLGFLKTLYYVVPLVFIHHTLIFWVEHGKLEGFGMVMGRACYSTLFSSVCIIVINFAIGGNSRRI